MESVFEAILEIFVAIYLEIMTAVFPETKFKKWQIKIIAGIEAIVLLIIMIIGAIMIAETKGSSVTGKFLTIVAVTIIVLQSITGIMIKKSKGKKK